MGMWAHGGQADAETDDYQNGESVDIFVQFLERGQNHTLISVDLVHPLVQAVDNLFC